MKRMCVGRADRAVCVTRSGRYALQCVNAVLKSLDKDARLLNQHVVDGVRDVIRDANQFGQHPLLCHRRSFV